MLPRSAANDSSPSPRGPRAGRCVLIGRPNVGKSTLLNALIGQKLAPVTPRPGTTRRCLLGVCHRPKPPTQIAFVDTPGTYAPKSPLGRVLAEEARAGTVDANAVLVVTDVSPSPDAERMLADDRSILELARSIDRPVVLAINKVDALRRREYLLPVLAGYEQAFPFVALVPISARDGANLDALVAEIRGQLPSGVLYDPDFITDRPERFFVTELIREAALQHTRHEVPHGIAVVIEQYAELKTQVRIHALLVVERPSHKKIVVGAGGRVIKQIGIGARKSIEELLGRKVHLELWVKVEKDWTQDVKLVRELVHPEKS